MIRAPFVSALLQLASVASIGLPPGSEPMSLREILKLDVNASKVEHELIKAGSCSDPAGAACKQYNGSIARAFASLTVVGQCGPDERLKQWSCQACRSVGFDVVPNTSRVVIAREFQDPTATSVYAAQLTGSLPQSKPRLAEPVAHSGENCLSHCRNTTGYCQWCGVGNVCCRRGDPTAPQECLGGLRVSGTLQSECRAPAHISTQSSNSLSGCALSFRGSKNTPNYILDAVFFLTDMGFGQDCPGCKAHLGYLSIWHGIERKILDNLNEMGCVPGTPHGNLLVTGHSLGAGVASLAMFHLQAKGFNVMLSYNFESPRVGNKAWSKAFQSWFGRDVPMFRVTHKHDIVVRVPPALNPPFPFLDFFHVASEVFFPGEDEKNYKVCEGSEDGQCADRLNWLEAILLNGGEDHCKAPLPESHDICSCQLSDAATIRHASFEGLLV